MAPPGPELTRAPGIYALALFLPEPTELVVGALGRWRLPEGHYVYVGSAWGAGGIAARVGRHLLGSAALRWHIDYLRAVSQPCGVWLAPGDRGECVWAAVLLAYPGADPPIPGFGASDCRCYTHLARVAPFDPHALTFPGGQWHSTP
ncbi:MAG: GIY-YIG nuclease family protein [Anaerolineae bacterium]|nr:GIY-YIG nuclease family protein [Anaerolineae bacterium]